MHRFPSVLVLILCAFVALPAAAEEPSLEDQVANLRAQVADLEAKKNQALKREIDSYLETHEAWGSAQGGGPAWLDKVNVTFRILALGQATAGLDTQNRHIVDGHIDIDFDFDITEKLKGFIYLTANNTSEVNDRPPSDLFFITDLGASEPSGAGFPTHFGEAEGNPVSVGTRTMSGFMDGIGVDGNQPVAVSKNSSVQVYEAGFTHTVTAGKQDIHYTLGKIDPRIRFGMSEFAMDHETQWLNNIFVNPPAHLWLTDSSGRDVLGIHAWTNFGENLSLALGWFNVAGEFFTHGQFMLEVHYKGQIGGADFNLKGWAFIDEFFRDAANDGSTGGGVVFDWRPKAWVRGMGFFFKVTSNSSELNPVKVDGSLGLIFDGPFQSRPDDQLGFAFGLVDIRQDSDFGVFPEDSEGTLEIYYRFVTEGGKMEITPNVQVVTDPGGGLGWQDDTLTLFGLRFFVVF